MHVDLTPELEQLVENKVQSGHYGTPGDVIREALRLLQQRDELLTLQRGEIRRQIDEGWQSAQEGSLVDGDEVFDRFESELDAIVQPAFK